MKAKNYIALIGAALVFAGAATSCHDDMGLTGGQGTLMIKTSISSDVKVRSRATIEELSETCKIYISNAKGPVRKYVGISQVPADGIDLLAGHYIAQAWAGDSVPASFDRRFFKGQQEFDIVRDQQTSVDLVCKIANTLVSVNYSDAIDDVISNYTMTVGHAGGSLTFEGRDDRKGYFMMTPKNTNLECVFSGTLPGGQTYTRKTVIENAKPATEYTLNVTYNAGTENLGGGYFSIEIDEHAVEIEDEVVIALSPEVSGYNFDINETQFAEPGNVGRKSVVVYGAAALTDVVITSDVLGQYTSIGGNDVNLMTMTEGVKTALTDAGVDFKYEYDAVQDYSYVKINFEETLLNQLPAGEYAFNISATDANNKTSSAVFKLTISDAPLQTVEVNPTDVWATKATVCGSILKDNGETPALRIRKTGTSDWTSLSTTVNGTSLSAVATGLEPGTSYQYQAFTPSYTSGTIMTFTTEDAAQLPNASFEDWQTDGKVRLIYGPGQSMFWDSGNKGSATLNKNVTDASTEKVHSGQYSAKLSSQFVGIAGFGKFAAGNIFIGQFLNTDGTDGILGWGRPWSSRPTALKGYMHYTSVAVTDAPNGAPIAKGDPDVGIIYIAILDSQMDEPYNDSTFPIIVKTKDKKTLFSKDDPNVIAYGELVITESTAGDALVEFNIPLTYKRTDMKAANIAIVASASRYGDYFAGGSGSTLYIDDLQLVY